MVVGLSKDFYENGGAEYKQKYSNMDELINTIRRKAISIKKRNETIKEQVAEIEKKMNQGFFIIRYMRKAKLEQEVMSLKNRIIENLDKIERHKRELKKIKRFQKNEEYSKILGTILEICVLPKRYAYVTAKNETP